MDTYRILVVEDDPATGQSLLDGFRTHGFEPHLCTTGGKGIEFVGKHSPYLIVLDICLPDGSGFDFCRQLRQLGFRQPIIMLTAQHDELDKVLVLEMGADDYMTKPFSLRELVSRARAQLRRVYGAYSSADSAQVLIHDVVLDSATGQARRGDESLNLTPTEFRLLSYLARHRGQALSRAQIVEAVWGFAPDIENEKTVNVHMASTLSLVERVEMSATKSIKARFGKNTVEITALGTTADALEGLISSGDVRLWAGHVKAIVESHSGRVEAQSAGSGMGSAFVVRIPTEEMPRS